MSSKGKQNSSESENMCVVCFKNVEIYSIGICDHPVCFECSTRMRVLCRQNECPICRQDMPKVIFCNVVQPFRNVKPQYNCNLIDRKFGIEFQTFSIQKAYNKLLEHNCKKCRLEAFRNLNQLKEHMRKEHELFYCDLCVTNLRIFTWERKCYTRAELAQHRRKGDSDDTSHRGHPLCEFCDTRYMDNDELFRHLRRDHLFCHFCDADGLHQYYPTYECLRQHFQSKHYLCEEGECINEQFTSVFRTDIDLKAHRASVHGKQLGKAASKQARTLELEFTLAPRPRPDSLNNRGSSRKPPLSAPPDRPPEDEGAVGFEPHFTDSGPSRGIMLSAQDFPSLGGVTPSPRPTGNVTIRHISRGQNALARTNENFPALGDLNTVRFSITPGEHPSVASNVSNVSIHVNHRPNGAITTHISQNNRLNRVDAFPVLGAPPPANLEPASWGKQSAGASRPNKPNKVTKNSSNSGLPSRDSSTDFPTLRSDKVDSVSGAQPLLESSMWGKQSKPNKTSKIAKSSAESRDLPTESDFSTLKFDINMSAPPPPGLEPPLWTKQSVSSSKPNKPNKVAKNPLNSGESLVYSDFPLLKYDALQLDSDSGSNLETPIWVKQSGSSTSKTMKSSNKVTKNSSNSGEFLSDMDKTKKSTVTVPVSNSWIGDSCLIENKTQKTKKKKSKNNVITNFTNNNNNNLNISVSNEVNSKKDEKQQQNGVKKRCELKIDSLQISDEIKGNNRGDGEDFPHLGASKPPPGFLVSAPPGFAANDLTFTNSSGQSYSILPPKTVSVQNQDFSPPVNFSQRNKKLVESFMTTLASQNSILEFKNLSSMFRNGLFTAEQYYHHCKQVMKEDFPKIFPELLVLLPDINKQQELYTIYSKDSENWKNLEVCATCNQVMTNSDLRSHLMTHSLQRDFPALGSQEVSSVWKK